MAANFIEAAAQSVAAAAKLLRPGRPPKVPGRESWWLFNGLPGPQQKKTVRKKNVRTLRNLGNHPLMRKAINSIKNPIACMAWGIRASEGYDSQNADTNNRIMIGRFMIANPNGEDSFRLWVEQILEDALTIGGAATETRLSGDAARPVWFWPVDAGSVEINTSYRGLPNEPKYVQKSPGWFGKSVAFTDSTMMYIKPNPTTYSAFGKGPVEIVFDLINDFLTSYDYAHQVETDTVPSFLIDLGPKMDADKITSFRIWWKAMVEGKWRQPITGGYDELKIHKLFGDNATNNRISWMKFLILLISLGFGLSPMSLGLFESTNRSTAEQQAETVDMEAIKPWAHLMAEYINRHIFRKLLGWHDIEFYWIDVEKADEERERRMDKIDLDGDVVTPDEVRARRNLPPHKSGIGALVKTERTILVAQSRGTQQVNVTPGGLLSDPELPEDRKDLEETKKKPQNQNSQTSGDNGEAE